MLDPFDVHLGSARAFVSASAAEARLGDRHTKRRLAYRDVASSTNRLTLIAAILPAGCVSTHTVFCLRTPLSGRAQHYLCGLFNSVVVNYFVRQRVTTHVTTAVVERLPVPTEGQAGPAFQAIAALARSLARRRRPDVLADLHARAARLYGLTAEDFAHVLGTFPLIPDVERDAALRAFEQP
jgi:hypothetical protein